MASPAALLRRHAVSAYFLLTFAISWGGFLVVVGPGVFQGSGERFETLIPKLALAMLAGPTTASLIVTALVAGPPGLRALAARLLRWRVHPGWYAFALVPAPLLVLAVQSALALPSLWFTTDDRATLLVSGLVAGCSVVFEELGWTGLAVPRLLPRHGVVRTGLIVGVLWGAWHLLQTVWASGAFLAGLPAAIFLPLNFLAAVAQLSAYRILLTWLYARTESILLVTLMHGSLTTTTVFLLRPAVVGAAYLSYIWLIAAGFWVLAGLVVVGSRLLLGRLRRFQDT